MNIRELNVGLVPTKEFEFHHTYSALKHFPTLRRNMREMKLLTMRADSMTQSGLNHSKQQLAGLHFPYGGGESIGRSTGGASVRSTRVLDDLKKSSLEEIHSLSDYHRILIENRKSQRSTSSDQRSSSGDSSAHRHSSKGPQPQPHTLNGSSTPFISDDFSYSTLPSIETNSNTIITRATGVQGYMGSVGDFHVDGNSTYEQQQQHPSFSSSALGHNDQSSYDDALSTANAKMTKISTSFNSQNYHSCVRAFQGPLLDMADFATQLKRCLNINLRAVEVAALFEKMDTRHDGRIDGVEFVRYFFALGATLYSNHHRLVSAVTVSVVMVHVYRDGSTMGHADRDGHQEHQEGEGPAQAEDRGRGEVRGRCYIIIIIIIICSVSSDGGVCVCMLVLQD